MPEGNIFSALGWATRCITLGETDLGDEYGVNSARGLPTTSVKGPMMSFSSYIASGGVENTISLAQNAGDYVMNLAIDIGTSQEGGAGIVSTIVASIWQIFATVAGLGFFGRAAFNSGKDTKQALMTFAGGAVITACFVFAPRIFGITEDFIPALGI